MLKLKVFLYSVNTDSESSTQDPIRNAHAICDKRRMIISGVTDGTSERREEERRHACTWETAARREEEEEEEE